MSTQLVKLKDIIQKPLSGEWGEAEGDINVIRTTNFTNDGKLNLTDVVKRNIDNKKINLKQLIYGDIIIEKSGGSPSQPVGRVVYFEEKVGIFLCNNFTSLIRGKSQVDNRYLFWFLYNNHLIKNTLKYQNKTTGIINLQLERYIEDLQIPLPPLATQKRIAEILDAADALKRKDQELLKKYDELAQAIFIDMFGDPVKNEMGWEVKTIKSTTNIITYGLTVRPHYIENGIPLISARELRNGFVNYTGAPKISNLDFNKLSSKCKPQKGDILFSKTGSIGLSAIVDGTQEFAVTQNAARINFKNEFYETYFIYALLRQEAFINKCVSLVKGNAVKDLQLGDFSEIEIICPPTEKQIIFSEMSLKSNELIKNSKDNFIFSDNLFNSLIQKAFNGDLVN